MPRRVNRSARTAAPAILAGAFAVAAPAWGGESLTTGRACGGEAWSYAVVLPHSAPDGRYAVGPQTFCAEVAREAPSPLGSIEIVIDPFSDRAAPPIPVPPVRRGF